MLKNLALLLFSTVFALLLAEAVLRLFTVFPIHGGMHNRVDDSVLLYRTSPAINGVDRDGFRNPEIKDSYDIAALGDSQTYGWNVSSEESWPQLLGKALGQSVYNFGTGGYNPIQYLGQFNLALKKNPKTIIVGFFPWNDFSENCPVLALPYWQEHMKEYGLSDAHCAEEKTDTEEDKRSWDLAYFSEKIAFVSLLRYVYDRDFGGDTLDSATKNGKVPGGFREKPRRKYVAEPTDEELESVEGLRALSNKPDIENAEAAFAWMNEQAAAHGIDFVVLIIPSRMIVTAPLEARVKNHRLANEIKTRRIFFSYFRKNKIRFVDALPFVIEASAAAEAEGRSIYPSSDSHPILEGYMAYANALLRKYYHAEPIALPAEP